MVLVFVFFLHKFYDIDIFAYLPVHIHFVVSGMIPCPVRISLLFLSRPVSEVASFISYKYEYPSKFGFPINCQ